MKIAPYFSDQCLIGLKPNKEKISENLERNLMLITKLCPIIGYEVAAEVAHEAYKTGKTLKEVILEKGIMKNETEIKKALDPTKMVSPGLE